MTYMPGRRWVAWGVSLAIGATLLTSSSEPVRAAAEYQTPPASQEAEDLRRGIQKLLELQKKLQAEEAAKAAERQGQAAPGAAPANTPPPPALPETPTSIPAANVIAAPNAAPIAATQPGDPAVAASAPADELVGPPAGMAIPGGGGPASAPAVASAAPGDELVGPPANFRIYRPPNRRTPAANTPPTTPSPSTPPPGEVPVARAVPPADGKTEWFNFTGAPWEDVVKHFAERMDKPLLNPDDIVIGGELTYVNPRAFTKLEALDELNLLMQNVGYRFVETDNYIEVIPLSEMSFRLPIQRTYPNRDAYIADLPKLQRMDWVAVHYRAGDKPAQLLIDTFGDALPDHVRLSAVGNTNTIKLVGTVQDVNRFFDLVELLPLEPSDPRQIKVFEIQTNASEVERMVRDLLDLPQASPFNPAIATRRGRPIPGQNVAPQVGGNQGQSEPDVIITADERTNSLIVKAIPAQMSQIEKLIKQIDIKPNLGEFKTEVVPIQYGDANEIARVLTQIFQQEQGQTQQPNWQAQRQLQIQNQLRNRRPGQPVQPVQPNAQVSPESIIVEGIFERAKKTIRIAADERTNSLIVYANDDGQKRVKQLLEIIDVEMPSNFTTVPVVNTEAARIYPVVEQIAAGLTPTGAGRAVRGGPSVRIVLDEANNALHILAERENMIRIREVIENLDVVGPEMVRHVIHLEKLLPSKVAPTVQQILTVQPGVIGGGGGGFRGRRMGGGGGGVAAAGSAQVIPLDEARVLIVVCDDKDWAKVAETIQQWDDEAISDQPVTREYVLQNAEPGRVAGLVDGLYRNYQHPVLGRSNVLVIAQGNKLMVQAVEPAHNEIAELLRQLDVGDLTRLEVLRLQNADATDVAEQAARLFGGVSTGGGRGGRGAPAAAAGDQLVIEPETATNSLIVKADIATIAKVKDFALAQDVRVGQLVPQPRFYTMKFAKPRDVAEAVNALFGGGRSTRGGRGGGGGSGAKGVVTAIDTDTQVIVEAPAEKHTQIKAFIEQLDNPEGRETTTSLVKMPGAPVMQIANMLKQAFRERVQNQKVTAEFSADQTTETLLISVTESLMDEVDQLIAQYKEMTSELVMQRVFRKLNFATAEEAAKWLEPQLQASVTTLLGTAAAKQVQVVPDTRTGRLLIYAPQVAVKEAMLLLEEYDVDVPNPIPNDATYVEAKRLPGLDVRSLGATLDTAFGNRQRPDRLRAKFSSDELTETIVVSAPKDWKEEINTLIDQFAKDAESVTPVQQFYALKNADPAYVVQKLNDLLVSRIQQRRGSAVAARIKITADERGGRVVINAPALVHEEAATLVQELDQAATPQNQLRTIALKNIDAQQAFQVLQQVFQEKIQKQKTLLVTPDPVSNSVVVRGSDDDYNEIERWLTQQDDVGAGKKRELKVIALQNSSNPAEIINVLNERFTKRGAGQRSQVGTEMTFQALGTSRVIVSAPADQIAEIETIVATLDQATSEAGLATEFFAVEFADPNEVANVIRQFYGEWKRNQGSAAQNVTVAVANNTLLIRAPEGEMAKIRQLIDQTDADVPMALQIKSFDLKVMSAEQVAQQVNFFLATIGTTSRRGEIKPFAYGEPTTNTLVVGAPGKYMPFITGLIGGIEAKEIPQGVPKSYPLQFVRAEQVQQNIQAMLEAKVLEREGGRRNKTPVKVVAEPSTNRLFIYAPENYQALAGELVAMTDEEMQSGEVIRIVQLERGDASQLSQTLTAMQSSGRMAAGAAKVNITADAGSNSLILRGLPKDVADLQKHAAALEEKSDSVPDLRVFSIQYASTERVLEVLEPMFGEGSGGRGSTVKPATFTEDSDKSQLIITATRRQMAQIEAVINELDQNPYNADGTRKDTGGKQIYFVDIFQGDAYDIAYDVRDLFPDDDEGGPEINSDWDGRYIKVKCRPAEFPAVLNAIRDVEKRAKPDMTVAQRAAPPVKNRERVLQYLKDRMGNVEVQFAPTADTEESLVETLRPDAKKKKEDARLQQSRSTPDDVAKPARNNRRRSGAGADASWRRGRGFGIGCVVMCLLAADAQAAEPPAHSPSVQTPPAPARPQPAYEADQLAQRIAAELQGANPVAAAQTPTQNPAKPLPEGVSTSQPAEGADAPRRSPATVLVQPDGKILISGPKDAVDEVQEILDLIEEDLTAGQVIRIFEFTYGDVNAAAEVLNIMFNDRQAIVPQMMQQQQQQQMLEQQRRQQQQQGGKDDDKQGGGLMGALRGMVGGTEPGGRGNRANRQAAQGGQRLKIATDASHNYLIVKCDEADLPEIRTLLRELDIPPGESDIRVFQLVNVDAVEAAQNIKEVLKIDRGGARGGAAGRSPAAGAARGGQDMLQMLQAEMMSVPGIEGGAKIESVEIVPNKITNSLLVSAAPEAMKVIENLIETLEDLEGRDVVGIYYEDLKSAKVDDVVPLLRDIFAAMSQGKSSSPAALGPVTVSGDPRGNRIIFTAQAKDVATVKAQIATLDVEGQFADAETQVLQYGNAAVIADTVSAIFATQSSGSAGAGGPGGRGGQTGGLGVDAVRIAAEPATNSITVWGPVEKRNQIFKKVREFEDMSRRTFRDISVVYADAEDLADKFSQIFGGARAGRGGAADAMQAANAVVIVGDKNSKKLIVKAPDAIFKQIEALVKQFDEPNQSLQFATIPVTHADATVLVEKVKGAFVEYIAQLPRTPGGKPPFDPFTAVADPRTNSVTVVGTTETIAFVRKLLGEIDVPTPEEQLKNFKVIPLDKADAVTVADAINTFAQGGSTAPSGANRSGGRPGLTPGGGNGPMLAVNAIPETSLNAVMVYGKPDDVAIVEREVLQKLEQLGLREEFATLEVKKAPPSQIVSFVQQFFDTPVAEGGNPAAAARRVPKMIPNDTTKTIIVRGSQAQIAEVTDLVTRFDDVNLASNTMKIRKIKPGRDVAQLANEAGRIANEAESQTAQRDGRPARPVILGTDAYSNAIIMAGDPASFGMVDGIIDELEKIGPSGDQTTRIITTTNISAADVQSLVEQLRSQRQGTGAGNVGRRNTGNRGGNFQGFPGGGFNRGGGGDGGGGMPTNFPQNFRRDGGNQGGPNQGGNRNNRNRRGGGGSLHWQPPAERKINESRDSVRGGGPFIGVLRVPAFVCLLADRPAKEKSRGDRKDRADVKRREAKPQTFGRKEPARLVAASDDAPADAAAPIGEVQAEPPPAPPAPPPERQRPPRTRVADTPPPPSDDGEAEDNNNDDPNAAASSPAAPPVPPVTGVSGVLQSDLFVQPLGSRQVIVTGNEEDIAYLEQVLKLMEQSAPRPRIEIFALQNAKAGAIAEVVTKAMQQFIESRGGTPGPEDRFSISAESGSNSLIVAASETHLETIADLIEAIDVGGVDGEQQTKLVLLMNALASDVVAQLTPVIERLSRVRSLPAEAAPSIQAISRSNGVLIIGTPSDILEITRLIEALDVRIDDEAAGNAFTRAEVVLIPLQNAVAEDVAKTLTDLIKEQQDLAQQAAKGEAGAPFVRKLQLKTAAGQELPELDLEKPIRILPERGTNSLIIFSSAKNLEPLKALVAVFDTLPAATDVSVRAFVLAHASAESVATLLDKVFTEGKGALRRTGAGAGDSVDKGVLPPQPESPAARGLPYNVSVASDQRSNTVVVIGQKDAIALASGLITEMDRPAGQLGTASHIIELKNVAATKLAERLQELLDKRKAALGGQGNDARDSAVIIPEDRSNLLVVFASEEMFTMVSDLAQQLDQAPSYTTIDTRLRPLEYADAAKLQKLLQDMFDKRKEAEPGNEPKNTISILADARTNSLLLTGTRDFLTEAEQFIDRLDRAGLVATVEVDVIPVEFNTPANVATLVQEMVDKSRTEDNRGTPVYLKADPISRNLLVAASKEDMDQIRRWVDIIDKPARIGITTAIVPLQRQAAEDLAERVTTMFGGGGGANGGETGLSVTGDTFTNSVVIVGPPGLVDEASKLVRQLDDTTPIGGSEVRMIRLEQADAEDAAELLQNVLEGRSGGTGGGGGGAAADAARQVMLLFQQREGAGMLSALRSQISITADPRTNSLVVTAPAASMALVESLITAIDMPPRADVIQVYALRNSDAQQMSETLADIFQAQSTGGSGGSSRSSTGTGQGEEERQLAAPTAGGSGGREQIRFSADVRTNSVIAAGTPGYLRLAEELIYRLDTQPIEDRKTIVYAPRNIVAAELAASISAYSDAEKSRLESLGEDISAQRKQEREIVAIENEDANRVILSFSPRFESDVLEIIRELDQPPPQVSIETLIVEVTLDNSLELGIEFAWQDLQFTRAGPTDTTTFDYVGGTDVGAAGSGGLGGFTFAITGQDFNFLFRTLQSEGRLKVLSRPHIVAQDNQEAVIKVVDDVPYISGTSTSIAGQVTTQVNREEIGITLEVTPQINPDGFVRLEIRQEVSNLGTSSVPIAPGLNAPTFFRREAETTVTVRDGETVMLGGLITQRQENSEQKVPIAGDIPLLGALFRSQRDVNRKTELLVILTPRVIRGVEDFREESIYQRDRSGTLPGDILTSPFMNRLQVPPDEMAPPDANGAMGPFRKNSPERYRRYSEEGASRFERDEYPEPPSRRNEPIQIPPSRRPKADRNPASERGSYDLPAPNIQAERDALPARRTYDVPVPANRARREQP